MLTSEGNTFPNDDLIVVTSIDADRIEPEKVRFKTQLGVWYINCAMLDPTGYTEEWEWEEWEWAE